MKILGITDEQASGATLIEDGHILGAINEERIVHVKLARGFRGRILPTDCQNI